MLLANLFESLDAILPWQWQGKEKTRWDATFSIGQMLYRVTFHYEDETDFWWLSFTAQVPGSGPSTNKTGTGNAFKVYATVVAIAVAFTKENTSVGCLTIESDIDEGASRFRINYRIARELSKRLNWKLDFTPTQYKDAIDQEDFGRWLCIEKPGWTMKKLDETIDQHARTEFTCGLCEVLAYALHKKTGWPIYVEEHNGHHEHSWVMNPQGKAVDINGVHPSNYARTEYSKDGTVREATDEVLAQYAKKPPAKDALAWANKLIAKHPAHFGLVLEEATAAEHHSKLFHITDSVNLPSIMAHGLRPDKNRFESSPLVYLAGDAGHAMAYANHHGDWTGKPVLLVIDVAKLDPNLLRPDDVDLPDLVDDWQDCNWTESLDESGQCAYAGVIPPQAISVHHA